MCVQGWARGLCASNDPLCAASSPVAPPPNRSALHTPSDLAFRCQAAIVVGVAVIAGLVARVRWLAARSTATAAVGVKKQPGGRTVGFFHPYCNAGGGGERVLWCAVQALCTEHPDVHCVVYTGDVDAERNEILGRAQSRFGLTIDPNRVTFVMLRRRNLVEVRLCLRR